MIGDRYGRNNSWRAADDQNYYLNQQAICETRRMTRDMGRGIGMLVTKKRARIAGYVAVIVGWLVAATTFVILGSIHDPDTAVWWMFIIILVSLLITLLGIAWAIGVAAWQMWLHVLEPAADRVQDWYRDLPS